MSWKFPAFVEEYPHGRRAVAKVKGNGETGNR